MQGGVFISYRQENSAHASVEEAKGSRNRARCVGGSESPPYLRLALDELEAILPSVRRIELRGLDHQVPDNSEQPAVVAARLREFFA